MKLKTQIMAICHYKPLVVTHTNPFPSNDYILLDVIVGIRNSQGLHNVGEVAFKWQEDWVYRL